MGLSRPGRSRAADPGAFRIQFAAEGNGYKMRRPAEYSCLTSESCPCKAAEKHEDTSFWGYPGLPPHIMKTCFFRLPCPVVFHNHNLFWHVRAGAIPLAASEFTQTASARRCAGAEIQIGPKSAPELAHSRPSL
jgi:hypothetical protein